MWSWERGIWLLETAQKTVPLSTECLSCVFLEVVFLHFLCSLLFALTARAPSYGAVQILSVNFLWMTFHPVSSHPARFDFWWIHVLNCAIFTYSRSTLPLLIPSKFWFLSQYLFPPSHSCEYSVDLANSGDVRILLEINVKFKLRSKWKIRL